MNFIKMELDLSNYTTKSDLKAKASVNTSNLVANENLSSLKPRVDKLDIEQLNANNTYLNSLKNVVEIMLLKALCMKNQLQNLLLLKVTTTKMLINFLKIFERY